MRLDFFNVDEFCKDLKPVTDAKIYSKNDNSFNPDGLFSEVIFGPTRTATCACSGGTYWGRSKIGETCPTCGVDIAYASERRRRFAKIELPFAIINPIMYQILIKAGKTKMKTMMDHLLMDEKTFGYYYHKDTDRFIHVEKLVKDRESDKDEDPEIPEDCEVYKGIGGLHNIVTKCCEKFSEKLPLWQFISENLDKFYINNVIVPPSEIRPVSKSKNTQMRDKMNEFYMKILNFSLTYGNDYLDTGEMAGISQITFRDLQKHIFGLYDYIFQKFSKKSGLIRGSILGRRIDFSARAVISPDPSLNIGECSIPYVMALELYKLDIANVLIEKRKYKRYDSALSYIDLCIELEDHALFDIVSDVVKDQYVMLNRQPTLHRMGLLAFKPKINKDYVIKIHPFVCEPYNADFDGDQMAVYRPLYDVTNKEAAKKLDIMSNMLCPTTGGLVLGINQDAILGIYLLTDKDEKQKIKLGNIDTYKGRLLFNKCLPYVENDEFDETNFIDATIDKKKLSKILDDIARIFPPEVVAQTLDKIKDLGFSFTTMVGSTMSLENMYLENAHELKTPIFDSDIDISEKISKLQGKEVMEQVKSVFPYSVFIESGSRGKWDQANQIILSRGFVSNFAGEIQATPVRSNLMEGLTRDEYFTSSYGTRKGLLDTALNTGVSGYLTRKLIYCGCNLELDDTCDDCGTEQRLTLTIPKEKNSDIDPYKLAKSLIGRYVIIDGTDEEFIIGYKDFYKLLGTTVHVRSPIFCKNYNVCKKCYGDTIDILHSNYIGIVAAQALGEISTQLVLRTFHTSGIAQQREGGSKSDKQQDITDDLTMVKKVLHNSTPFYFMGEKYDHMNYHDALMCLYRIYSRYKTILFVHYECIVSMMMRVENVRWRLTEKRDLSECKMVSIESVPSKESWLLALAFSKVKHYVIDGVVGQSIDNGGILEKIMVNEKL